MKKYLYKLVIASLILMSATVVRASNEVYYINNSNIEMTEQEYNNLLGLGFTENQIADMNQDEYLANKNINGSILGEDEKYLLVTTVMQNGIKYTTSKEVTKEEALKEKQSQNSPSKGPASGNYYDGVIQTIVLKLTNKIIGVNASYMRYKADLEWLSMPYDRYHDLIGIGIEPSKVYIASPIVFKIKWRTSSNTSGYNTVGYPKTETTGGSTQMQLPSGSLQQLDAYIYFNVSKKSGIGTLTELHTCSDYAHATSYVNPSVIYDYYDASIAGLDIYSPYSVLYTSQTLPCASFVGTW